MVVSKSKALIGLVLLSIVLLFLGYYVYLDSKKIYVPDNVIEEQKKMILPEGY